MIARRRLVFAGVVVALVVGFAVGQGRAQLPTTNARVRSDGTVLLQLDLLNTDASVEQSFPIPNNQDLIVTDVVATCRGSNACLFDLFGPTHNESDQLVWFNVASGGNAGHSFNTGLRVAGGSGGQLFVRNHINPDYPSLLSVTITGYLVRK